MRNKDSQKFSMYITYELFCSDAFRDLKPSSKDILSFLYYEIDYSSRAKMNKKYVPKIKNRHEIKLPYRDIIERLGYSRKTIWTAFKDILAHGFIKINEYGGQMKGNYNVYGITEDWRKWEKGQIIRALKPNGNGQRMRDKIKNKE